MILISLFSAVYLFLFYASFHKAMRLQHWLSVKADPVLKVDAPSGKFCIILPCHKEAKIVFETLNWFNDIIDVSRVDASIEILVGPDFLGDEVHTSRSNDTLLELGSGRSTIREIRRWLRDTPGHVQCNVHVSENLGVSKAEKLNAFLFSHLDSMNAKDVVLIFDFDARPSHSFLKSVNDAKRATESTIYPLIMQAIPACFPIIRKELTFAEVLCVSHNERSVWEATELIRRDARSAPFFPLAIMGGCVGYNRLALEAILPLEVASDDITPGYRADFLEIRRVLLAEIVPVSSSKSLRGWFLQAVRIASSVFSRGDASVEKMLVASIVQSKSIRIAQSFLFDAIFGFRLIALVCVLWTATFLGARFFCMFVLAGFSLQTLLHLKCSRVLGATQGQPKVKKTLMTRYLAKACLASFMWPFLRIIAAVIYLLILRPFPDIAKRVKASKSAVDARVPSR